MEILAHFKPGESRNGKMQMMSIGNRRYMFQQGDVIDLSDVRKPLMFNKGGFQGGQVQVAFNKDLKKWILMTGSQTPITDSTPEAPNGKYDDPHLDDKRKNFKGLRGVRFYDVTDPSKIVKLSEFSTGATGQGTHRNYYDGGKYAYLDTAPDETFIHQPAYFRQLVNGNMIVDATDPSNVSQVSMWWVPGSRKGEEAEYNKWIWSKLVPPKVAKDQTPFAGLHGPVYGPKKLEDGGNRGYGAFGCNGFIILDLSDPKKQREVGRFEPPAQYSGMGIAFHTIYCGILDRGFCLLELRKRNPDLEGAPGIQVEKMILAPDGPVRNAFLVEQFAEFRMNARIVPLPKGAKRVFRIFSLRTCCARSAQSTRGCGRLIHQINIAIGASRESLPVLRFALGANHGAWEFTTKGKGRKST